MAGPSIDAAAQVVTPPAGAATMMITANTRVRGRTGPVGSLLDTFTFADGGNGRWLMGNLRTRIGGMVMVSATSVGQYAGPNGTAPLLVAAGDSRIRSR